MFHLTNQQPYDCLSSVKREKKKNFHMHIFHVDILLSQLSMRGVEILSFQHVWVSAIPDQKICWVPAVAKGPV